MRHLTLTRIADIRAWIDSNQLTGPEHRVADGALEIIRKQWRKRRREEYNRALAERDRQHEDLIQELSFPHRKALEKLTTDLASGVLTAAEARAQLRDLEATRQRFAAVHKAFEDQEEALEKLDSMSVEDYQDRTSRAPYYQDHIRGARVMPVGEMTFGQAINEHLTKPATGPRR